MTKTLVTGGTGFVGSSIVRRLVNNRETVVVLTRKPNDVPRSRRVAGAYYIEGDVFNADSLKKALEGCDAVIHAVQFENAPFEDARKGLTYEKVDGEGTERLVAAVKEAGIKRLLYISGAGTREGRTEPWFKAKIRAEQAVRTSGANWTIFRPSWIYGPQDKSLNKFSLFARIAPVVPIIGTGREKIQPVYIEDIANIVNLSLNNSATFEKTFDIGGPEVLSMKKIVQTMLEVQGKKRIILPQPKALMKIIASVVQYLPGRPLTPDGVDFVTMEEYVDTTLLRQTLPIELTPLKKGLSAYM